MFQNVVTQEVIDAPRAPITKCAALSSVPPPCMQLSSRGAPLADAVAERPPWKLHTNLKSTVSAGRRPYFRQSETRAESTRRGLAQTRDTSSDTSKLPALSISHASRRVPAAMDTKMQAWRKKMPSTRALASSFNQLVQQKSVAVLYTPTEVERIKQMTDMIAQATSDYEADEDWDRILRVYGDRKSRVGHGAGLGRGVPTVSSACKCCSLTCSRLLLMVRFLIAFCALQHEFPLFVDTYHNMRKKGIKFPEQYDESKVPVLTPPPEAPSGGRSGATNGRSTSSNQASSIDTSSYSNTTSGLGGLSTPELYRVATNVSEMFEDMLFEAQKDTASIGNHGVMEELAVEVREIVHRMEGAIPIAVAEGDENLEKYLSINDDLHAALKRYEALLTETEKVKPKSTVPEEVDLVDPFGLKEESSSKSNQDSNDDDPFADFVRVRTGPKTEDAKHKKTVAPVVVDVTTKALQPDEEDDPFASFVQQRATKILSSSNQDVKNEKRPTVSTAPAAPAKDLIDLWDASLPGPSSTTNSTQGANSSDPFDMLDFTSKVSILFAVSLVFPFTNKFWSGISLVGHPG
ncbi:unnamed protein product [Phytophthora lilii]|uniref:Unnamed protein product n=1 Tax=Phytophthora lilii TaxID=2077276 RepID=A0A9W6TRE5_9STRA|nr:unnamed protein product [Phytophthora lilii]